MVESRLINNTIKDCNMKIDCQQHSLKFKYMPRFVPWSKGQTTSALTNSAKLPPCLYYFCLKTELKIKKKFPVSGIHIFVKLFLLPFQFTG
jgi:hypothetical protein